MAIKKKIKTSTITISLEYSNTKVRDGMSFQQDPGPYLMREYNETSKSLRKELQDERIDNIKQIAETTLIHNRMLVDKSVNTLI